MLKKIIRGAPHLFGLAEHIRKRTPFGFSFNLADRCPIRCQCYWRALERVRELPDDAVIRFFDGQKQNGMLLATIVGGEPYVRPELLERVAGILPATWVVTSGTTPLIHLPGTTHFVSIDGADAATHDAVRRSPGLYARILKNIERVRARGKFPLVIHSVLNRMNYGQIEKILETWKGSGLADYVVFSTATPIRGIGESLNLTEFQREGIVGDLLSAKRRFGKFLAMSEKMILRLAPSVTRKQNPKTCLTTLRILSYDAAGDRIPKCIFGDKADCSACGCIVTAVLEPFVRFDPATWLVLARLYTP
jgi:MoaA/NifB/PqqE/SkfB family radical SAM enzyme